VSSWISTPVDDHGSLGKIRADIRRLVVYSIERGGSQLSESLIRQTRITLSFPNGGSQNILRRGDVVSGSPIVIRIGAKLLGDEVLVAEEAVTAAHAESCG